MEDDELTLDEQVEPTDELTVEEQQGEQPNQDQPSDKQTESEESNEDTLIEDDNAAPPLKEQPVTTPEDELDPLADETAKIEKAINKALQPVLSQNDKQRIDAEWQVIAAQYPEAKGIENKVKRWASTDGSLYKGLPLTQTFQAVVGPDFFIKLGAKRAAAAEKAAKETQGNHGGGKRPAVENANSNQLSLVGKSRDEINKIINQAKSGRLQA